MQVEKLISMAGQVATFFRPYPDGADSVRKHLVAFWTPAMVDMLERRVAEDASGIDPLVVAAMRPDDHPAGPLPQAPAMAGEAAG